VRVESWVYSCDLSLNVTELDCDWRNKGVLEIELRNNSCDNNNKDEIRIVWK